MNFLEFVTVYGNFLSQFTDYLLQLIGLKNISGSTNQNMNKYSSVFLYFSKNELKKERNEVDWKILIVIISKSSKSQSS